MKNSFFGSLVYFMVIFTGWSQTNNWTSSLTGNWHDLSWSAGIRPLSNHWVHVTNSGSKAVIVNTATRDNFPTAMTVSNLTLSAPPGWTNTILLNFTGTSMPFKVLDRCYVGTNGVLLNLFGGLIVGKSNDTSLVIEGGTVRQEGGSNIINGYCAVGTDAGFGRFVLSNGVFQTSSLDMNSDGGGRFDQWGGLTLANDILVGSHFHDASFNVSNGIVRAGFIGLRDGHFNQVNSDVFVTNSISISSAAIQSTYSMTGGSLNSLYTWVGEGTSGSMHQVGGNFTTGQLRVEGNSYLGGLANFTMSGGTLIADSVYRKDGVVHQDGGTVSVRGDVDGGISQSGGLLMSSNTYITDFLPFTFVQSGGTNITTNTFLGYNTGGTETSRFVLQGGRLDVSNLVVGFDFIRSGGTFTNRGQIVFRGGRLFPTLPEESFGAINVELDSDLILPTNHCVMHFTHSASIPWNGHFYFGSYIPSLKINNWKGSTNGGGMHQIIVGTNGLTAEQLEQVVFVDPAGLPAGGYNGKILNNGELVPTTTLRLSLRDTTEGPLLRWPGGQTLQTATNVNGPYSDVVSDLNFFRMPTNQPKQFFRLKN